MENPPKKFFRLSPGKEVRLRYAYFITCREVVKNADGRGGRAALHLRSRHARRQRAGRAQGAGHHALGVGGGRCAGRGAASTTRCSRGPIPTRRNFAADLNPNSLEVLSGAACWSRRWRATMRRRPCSSSGRAISAATATPSRAARVQPHRRPARHLGEGVGRRQARTGGEDEIAQ